MGIQLEIEPLTREAFAPFGDVIACDEAARHFAINEGTTERFHDLARVDVADGKGRALINIFRAQPRELPMTLTMMERHPLSSQAFIPLSKRPYLVVVAPPAPVSVFFQVSQDLFFGRNTALHFLLPLLRKCGTRSARQLAAATIPEGGQGRKEPFAQGTNWAKNHFREGRAFLSTIRVA